MVSSVYCVNHGNNFLYLSTILTDRFPQLHPLKDFRRIHLYQVRTTPRPPACFHVILIEKWKGWSVLHHISEAFSDKIINNCPNYFDYDNTSDFDGSIFIFCARLIVSREGAFFLQTTTTTKPGSAALIPSEDGGWSLAHSESILTQQMANQGNILGLPTTVSSKMRWKHFLGYPEYF